MKKIMSLLLSLLLLSGCSAQPAETTPSTSATTTKQPITPPVQTVKTFQNPISRGNAPDPFIQYIDGYYYALYTEADKITLYRNTTLKSVLRGESKVVYQIGKEVGGNIWAPELHYNPTTDRWYIYASGSTNGWEFGTIRMFCLESTTSDPFGEYRFKGFTDSNVLAIDQTVFYDEASDTLYTAFSEFTNIGQVITFAVMDNPWTISSQRMRLSFPEHDWEKMGVVENKDSRVNEGPIFLLHNGKLTLLYSASGCWSEYYCLGQISFTGKSFEVSNMMNVRNWKKSDQPVFSAANEVYGVGHCSFFHSPDGTETWIAYHGMATPDAGEGGRYMYAQRIEFDANDRPVLGKPLSRKTKIPVPSK
jgi:GH43 family beta-xylosidase